MSTTFHSINSTIESVSPPRPTIVKIRTATPDQPNNGPPNLAELTSNIKNADSDSFGKLIQDYRGTCMKRALLMLRNLGDAEDAVQSAFQKAFQYREQFQGNGTFAAWLARIVENECLMRIRRAKHAHLVYLDSPTESNVRLELIGPASNPEDELGRKEVTKILRKEILRMPPLFRNVILLRVGDQLPMPKVAERLGLSIPAAKSRLERARRELRSRMGKHCGQKGPGTLLKEAVYTSTVYRRAS